MERGKMKSILQDLRSWLVYTSIPILIIFSFYFFFIFLEASLDPKGVCTKNYSHVPVIKQVCWLGEKK